MNTFTFDTFHSTHSYRFDRKVLKVISLSFYSSYVLCLVVYICRKQRSDRKRSTTLSVVPDLDYSTYPSDTYESVKRLKEVCCLIIYDGLPSVLQLCQIHLPLEGDITLYLALKVGKTFSCKNSTCCCPVILPRLQYNTPLPQVCISWRLLNIH